MRPSNRMFLEKPRWIQNSVNIIVHDILDRRGIGNEMENIDEDVRDEIRLKWAEIIEAARAGDEK